MVGVVIYRSKWQGRKYTVYRNKQYGILLQINDHQSTQSIGGIGRGGFYYDEIALLLRPLTGRVLLLGTAGGTIARRTREMGGQARFIGIDNDPEMIRIARLFFNVDKYVDEIIIADARKFVLNYVGDLFDAVVVDLYVDAHIRVPIDARRLVRRGGLYIENDLSSRRVLSEIIE